MRCCESNESHYFQGGTAPLSKFSGGLRPFGPPGCYASANALEVYNISVQLSLLQSLITLESVHEDYAPSNCMAEITRLQSSHINRRQHNLGLHKGGGHLPSGNFSLSVQGTGICGKSPQVNFTALPGDTFPEIQCKLGGHDHLCAADKAGEDMHDGKGPAADHHYIKESILPPPLHWAFPQPLCFTEPCNRQRTLWSKLSRGWTLYKRVKTQTTNQRRCNHGLWPEASVGQQIRSFSNRGLETQIPLDTPLKEMLQRWVDQAHHWNGCSLLPPAQSMSIRTDVLDSQFLCTLI